MNLTWMMQFLRLVWRDTHLNFHNELRYLSGWKMIKFFVISFFTAQIFYFSSKFLVYADFSLTSIDWLSLFFIIFIFPFLFTYEKFLSGGFFVYTYDLDSSKNIWDSVKEKFDFYGTPLRAWPTYLLSQAAVVIDIVIFSSIFVAALFLSNIDVFSYMTWIWLGVFICLVVLFFIVAVFLWNRTFQIFRFWDKEENVLGALKQSHKFTTNHPRRFITLHTIVKTLQFLIPTLFILLAYRETDALVRWASKFSLGEWSIYVVMAALSFLGFFLYQILVVFANSYAFRLARYFEQGNLDGDYIPAKNLPKRKDTQKLRLANYLVLSIGIFSIFMFIHNQIAASKTSTERVQVKYPNIIKTYSGGLNSTTTIDLHLTPSYSNGIAVSVFVEDGQLYAQPLVSQMNNPLIPAAVNVTDIPLFNLSQTFVPTTMKVTFDNAVEFSNARKFALFVYVSNKETAEALAVHTQTAKPSLTVFMTDSESLSEELSKSLSNYRVGTLSKSINVDDYQYKQAFFFNKDVDKTLLASLQHKGIKVYIILKEGERPDESLDLSSVQGIFTDLPQLSYTEVRNISESEVLKKVILSPLRLFGF